MKIGNQNFSNFNSETVNNASQTPKSSEAPRLTSDSMEGPTGQTQQALFSDHDPDDPRDPQDLTRDHYNGLALLFVGAQAGFGMALPFAVMGADASLPGEIGDLVDASADWFGKGVASLGEYDGGLFADQLEWLGNAIADTPETIGEPVLWLGEKITDAGNALGDVWDDGIQALERGVDQAVETAEDAVDFAGDVVDWAGERFDDAKGGFFDGLNAIGEPVIDAVSDAYDAAEEAVNDAPDAAGDAIDTVGDAVSDAVSTVTDW